MSWRYRTVLYHVDGRCLRGRRVHWMGPARARQEGRKRRTTAEVRAAITEAALTLFAERGYGGTSTRDITTRAGVAEPLLFRHFGSKSNLFEQAVIEPFSRFVKDYIAEIGRASCRDRAQHAGGGGA